MLLAVALTKKMHAGDFIHFVPNNTSEKTFPSFELGGRRDEKIAPGRIWSSLAMHCAEAASHRHLNGA